MLRTLFIVLLACCAANAQMVKVNAFPNLPNATRPVFLTHDHNNNIYVVEQAGRILVTYNTPSANRWSTFLDIRNKVFSIWNEKGMLGMAMDPDHRFSGYFYVYYTDNSHGIVSRFKSTGTLAYPNSEKIIFKQALPSSGHNGGMLEIGNDGALYLSIGDNNNPLAAQDNSNFLGTIVRIDVDDDSYPAKVWANGLRNPWRFSFDQQYNACICGDVGQGSREELSLIYENGNYGWPYYEGSRRTTTPMPTGFRSILPVWEYPRNVGRCIIGGYIYRGTNSRLAPVNGLYFYGDFSTNKVWVTNGFSHHEIFKVDRLASFGRDKAGELYMLTLNGPIYRLDSR